MRGHMRSLCGISRRSALRSSHRMCMADLRNFGLRFVASVAGLAIAAISLAQSSPSDDLLVGYRTGVDAQSAAKSRFSANFGGVQPELNAVRMRFSSSSDRAAAIQRLLSDPRVRYVEPNYTVAAFSSP